MSSKWHQTLQPGANSLMMDGRLSMMPTKHCLAFCTTLRKFYNNVIWLRLLFHNNDSHLSFTDSGHIPSRFLDLNSTEAL